MEPELYQLIVIALLGVIAFAVTGIWLNNLPISTFFEFILLVVVIAIVFAILFVIFFFAINILGYPQYWSEWF